MHYKLKQFLPIMGICLAASLSSGVAYAANYYKFDLSTFDAMTQGYTAYVGGTLTVTPNSPYSTDLTFAYDGTSDPSIVHIVSSLNNLYLGDYDGVQITVQNTSPDPWTLAAYIHTNDGFVSLYDKSVSAFVISGDLTGMYTFAPGEVTTFTINFSDFPFTDFVLTEVGLDLRAYNGYVPDTGGTVALSLLSDIPMPTPEPETLSLIGMGIISLFGAWYAKRRG